MSIGMIFFKENDCKSKKCITYLVLRVNRSIPGAHLGGVPGSVTACSQVFSGRMTPQVMQVMRCEDYW